ncbi:MAG: DNA repair protein RadA [Deltaproteobacteria bacterium]|nr:DNA repair protein RadA [Deltaproteobacteria bacterium]
MAKTATVYECQQCGYQTPKWLGKCSDCGAWNSLVEARAETLTRGKSGENFYSLTSKLAPLDEIGTDAPPRVLTRLTELDRLLGGGMVPGSVILLGGDPGIGKSTLVLQILSRLCEQGGKVAYLSGEESADQIKLRAERLGVKAKQLYVMTENDLSRALPQIEELKPQMLVVDSIQTVYQPDLGSAPGSVTQVRECAGKLLYLAKSRGLTVLLVGHVTKEGSLAGPKILEHMVDTVLYFEGDRGQPYRILRTFKNRFGSVSELAVYEMRSQGLVEVTNPSELFLSDNPELSPGSVVVSSLQGTRPILAELQALVTPSSLGMPRRVTVGVDSQRVALLGAVLEKIVGIQLGGQDIFLNVVGGLDVDEPAVDLGVLMAMVSSFQGKALARRTLVMGEVGLSGEIRPVAGEAIRLQEASRLGFQRAILPKKGSQEKLPKGLELERVANVGAALDLL